LGKSLRGVQLGMNSDASIFVICSGQRPDTVFGHVLL